MATAARPRSPPEPEPRYHPATGRNTFQWGGPTFRHSHPARQPRRRHSGLPSLQRRPKSGKVCLDSGRHRNAGKLKPPNRKPCSRRLVAFLLGGLIPTVIPAGGLIPTVIPVAGLIFTVIPDIYRHSGASRNPGIPNFHRHSGESRNLAALPDSGLRRSDGLPAQPPKTKRRPRRLKSLTLQSPAVRVFCQI